MEIQLSRWDGHETFILNKPLRCYYWTKRWRNSRNHMRMFQNVSLTRSFIIRLNKTSNPCDWVFMPLWNSAAGKVSERLENAKKSRISKTFYIALWLQCQWVTLNDIGKQKQTTTEAEPCEKCPVNAITPFYHCYKDSSKTTNVWMSNLKCIWVHQFPIVHDHPQEGMIFLYIQINKGKINMVKPNNKNEKKIDHYCDVIMDAMASQITSLTIVYPSVYSDADQIKHQSSASLAFVRGIHRWPVNSPHEGPATREMLQFDDVIMYSQLPG